MMPQEGWQIDPGNVLVWATGAAVLLGLVAVGLLVSAVRATRRTAAATQPLAAGLAALDRAVRDLDIGQHQLAGGLKMVTEHQVSTQARIMESVERRLEDVQRAMGESLHGSAARTARSLGDLHQRLETIDRAQSKIEKLSSDVIGLQDILSNKQARGAFGEIQLEDIVSSALPPDAYGFQETLSNGRRADCVIALPDPPGVIVVDAKFPLEAFEALRTASTEQEAKAAAQSFRRSVTHHVRAIAERYIVEGETADCALMFLPSEAVYAELHANFADTVRESFAHRVFVVSPTTMMATLNTMRAILKDARMRAEAGAIRRELGLLSKDLARLDERAGNLDRHFAQAARDLDDLRVSAGKAERRARRLDNFEFGDERTCDETADLAATATKQG